MGLSLYDLTAEYARVLERVDAADGVLDAQLEAELDAIVSAVGDKVDNVLALAATRDAEAAAFAEHEKRFADKKARASADAARLRAYAMSRMKGAGVTHVKGARFDARIQLNNPAVKLLVPEVEVPAAYVRTKTTVTTSIDKAAIKSDLDAGIPLPFAALERGERLVVR